MKGNARVFIIVYTGFPVSPLLQSIPLILPSLLQLWSDVFLFFLFSSKTLNIHVQQSSALPLSKQYQAFQVFTKFRTHLYWLEKENKSFLLWYIFTLTVLPHKTLSLFKFMLKTVHKPFCLLLKTSSRCI